MRLTKKGDYALRAVIQLASADGVPKSISHLSKVGAIPRNFAAKILKELANAGILKSYAGKNGGYRLAKSAEEISFREIIEAVEGPIIINRCIEDSSDCSRVGFCRMYDAWMTTQRKVVDLLDGVRISEIIDKKIDTFSVG